MVNTGKAKEASRVLPNGNIFFVSPGIKPRPFRYVLNNRRVTNVRYADSFITTINIYEMYKWTWNMRPRRERSPTLTVTDLIIYITNGHKICDKRLIIYLLKVNTNFKALTRKGFLFKNVFQIYQCSFSLIDYVIKFGHNY